MTEPLTSARLSAIAYSDKIKSIDKHKFIKRIIKEETSTSCNIYKKGKEIVITFEGTDSIRDLPILFDFRKDVVQVEGVDVDNIKIHRGFIKAYMSIHNDILSVLKRHKFDSIHCCGHSLGGALAEISILFLKNIANKVSVHTFASPRVGNYRASKVIYECCVDFKRFVITGDLVPHLPPFFFGYRHFTDRITLDRVSSKIIDSYLFNAVNNHKMLNYIKSIMIWTMEEKVTIKVDTQNED
tara:strand:- start:151 stop:873 length:723 start_codon:yes stop_codon:yes gene_type:complete